MYFPPRLLGVALVVMASAFAASQPLGAQATHRDLSPTPEIRQLELVGVSDAVDEKDLRDNIYTTATHCKNALLAIACKLGHYHGFFDRHYLDRSELKRDVLRIRVWYYKHGYRDATVDTSVTRLNDKQVAVRFTIAEGLPIRVASIEIQHDTTIIPRKKAEQLTFLHAGDPLDLHKLDSTRVFFQNELWEEGYADALVDTSTVVDATTRTAQVQVRLVPNHRTTISQIVITGTDKVSPTTVLNSLEFRPGDPYRRSSVIESQRNLYESNLFRLVALDVPQTFDSAKTVNVLLREAPLHQARLSAGFNTVDFIQTEGRFTAYNLLGGARRLELSATVGNLFAKSLNGKNPFHAVNASPVITGDSTDFLAPTWQTSVTLLQPAFLQRPRNSVSIGAFAQRRAVPSVVIDRGYGGNLNFTRTLAYRASASATYRFEVTRVEAGDAYFCVNFGVCEAPTIESLRTHQRLSPITVQAQSDRSDVPLAPTRGYVAHADLELANAMTVSDYRYFRASADGALYARFGGKNSVLASHLRLGFVRPFAGPNDAGILHPRKRFYAGGANSVRGFGENQLGPRILTLPHGYLINARDVNGGPCDASSLNIRYCDPNTAADSLNPAIPAGTDKFTPRPVGGTSLVEGSVEYRFPLSFITNLGGAVFVDGAAVGERIFDPLGGGVSSFADLVRGTWAITPGFGVRYYSPVGAIRVDLGFNPSRAEDLAVVSEVTVNGRPQVVPLATPYHYEPFGQGKNAFTRLLDRFTLHLSIGQAY